MTINKIIAADPETRSEDLVAGNIEHLRALFSEAFTEGKIDFDSLRQLLGGAVDEREEKYGLNWFGKRKARQIALSPSTGTLRPCPEDSVDWDTTQNIMIEGDNLEVLKLLQKSYAGKVKLIYIDPPYNTGNDFVYPDNYQDGIRNYLEQTGQIDGKTRTSSNTESNGRFHTDWLSMMYPRLKLARSLLREDGFICISIGDEEIASLKAMLNELFGEENFRNTIALRRFDKNLSRQFMENGLFSLSVGFEYLVIYSKSQEATLNPVFREASEERQANGYWKGFWNAPDRPTMRYSLLGVKPESGQWKWKGEVAQEAVNNYREYLEKFSAKETLEEYWERTGKVKKFIRRKESGKGANQGVEHWVPPSTGILRSSNWTDLLVSNPSDLMGVPFANPKAVNVLQLLITMASDDGDLVLDFFAGSGTTAHATLLENAFSNGNRRFVLVQLQETLDPDKKEQQAAVEFCDQLGRPRNIAELTKERLRRAITRIKTEIPKFSGDLGFRVFKLDSSNIRPWEVDRNNLPKTLEQAIEHVKTGRDEEDILYELLLKLGLDLSVPIENRFIAEKRVYAVGGGVIIVCLSEKIASEEVEPLAHGIIKWQKKIASGVDSICVFKDSSFDDDIAKSNMAAILEQNNLNNLKSL